MKLNLSAIFSLPLLVLLNLTTAKSQSWEIGGFIGSAGYMGDLNPVNPFHVTDIAYGGQLKRNFDAQWALKFSATRGTIKAADSDSENAQFRARNLSFFSPITELSLQTEFNFFKFIPSITSRRYTPYLFAGVGYVTFNPKAILDGKVYELTLYGTEGQDLVNSYKTSAWSVPYGAGIKFNPAGKWNIGAELGYRNAYTDYLDDVSGKYAPDHITSSSVERFLLADRAMETGNPRHTAGTQRGDYRKQDTYLFLGISITYSFFSNKCPVVD